MKKHHVITITLLCMFFCSGPAYAQEESAEAESAVTGNAETRNAAPQSVRTENTVTGNPAPESAVTGNTETQSPTQEAESTRKAKTGSEVKESAGSEDAKTRELLNKIEELEGKLNKLTEETSARKKLEITEEEKQEQEKQVLEAVGDEYTTEAKHTLSINYSFSYTYNPAEAIETNPLAVQDVADHTMTHTISTGYAILDNLSVSASVPFLYRYHKMGTTDQKETTDIGDISFGLGFQPFKTKPGGVSSSFGISTRLPTGRSPYKMNADTEISTGSGSYGYGVSGNFSRQIDPVVVFWNLGYSHTFPITDIEHYVQSDYILEKVTPGDSYSLGGGIAYAMSYKVSVNFGFSYSYARGSTYEYRNASADVKTADTISTSLSFGLGWRVSNKTTLSFGLGYGLTGSGFGITFRFPFSYVL